jgi:hypothetical protein
MTNGKTENRGSTRLDRLVDADFANARRGAFLTSLLALLLNRPIHLLSFHEVEGSLESVARLHEMGCIQAEVVEYRRVATVVAPAPTIEPLPGRASDAGPGIHSLGHNLPMQADQGADGQVFASPGPLASWIARRR